MKPQMSSCSTAARHGSGGGFADSSTCHARAERKRSQSGGACRVRLCPIVPSSSPGRVVPRAGAALKSVTVFWVQFLVLLVFDLRGALKTAPLNQ